MESESHEATALGALGAAIGKGLIAGLAGTIAMTVSQMIEMRITGRKQSNAPVKAVKKVLHIQPDKGKAEDFSNEIHYAYGSVNGVVRGLLSLVGITGFIATSVHLAAIWGTAITIEPKLDIAPPVSEWEPKDIAIDIFHHAVYAIVTGLVFEAID
ncbi:MAG: hypothetical protein M3Z56_09600 [Bacteroidota bacterium]|nr:hypothetical protein [Bacteroidota bacterium]